MLWTKQYAQEIEYVHTAHRSGTFLRESGTSYFGLTAGTYNYILRPLPVHTTTRYVFFIGTASIPNTRTSHSGYFGPGHRIGEAEIPAPGIDDPEDLRWESELDFERGQDEEANELGATSHTRSQRDKGSPLPLCISLGSLLQPNSPLDIFLETINCWLTVMKQRRYACQTVLHDSTAWQAHEVGVFKDVHQATVFLAQTPRAHRPPDTPAKPVSADAAHADPSSDTFGEHLETLQEAGREVAKSVKTAFDKNRRPTLSDVQSITTQLNKVAAVVVAGRHATANNNNSTCDHALTEFITEEEAFFCNACRKTMARGTRMAGCRQCDHDLCMTCVATHDHSSNTHVRGMIAWWEAQTTKARKVPAITPGHGRNARTATGSPHFQPRVAAASSHAHRRRGSGAASKQKTFNVFYGNVTSMSKKAKQYLAALKDDMWFAGETHINQAATTEACDEWTYGWDVTAAPAQDSSTSATGTYGGVMAAGRKHLCTQRLNGDLVMSGNPRSWDRAETRDLAGRTAQLRGIDVIILGGYARDGDWRSQIEAVASVTRNGSLPFIWLSDFNDAPDTLREEPWYDWLAAEVIVPDKHITCHAGSGSLIDFGIASRCLVPYIAEFTVVTDVPWGPHDGLRLRLHRSPRLIMVRSLRRPRQMGDAELTTTEGKATTTDWQTALDKAHVQVGAGHLGLQDAAKAQQELVERLGTTVQSNALGLRLATWAHATESQALAIRGITPGRKEQQLRGRALAPEFTLKPLMQRPRIAAESLPIPGGYGATARLWATGRALSAKLKAAIKRRAGEAELCMMRARIVALARRSTSGIRCAWEAIDDEADATAGLFAILIAGNPGTNEEMVLQAIGTFERLEAKEALKGKALASQSFHRWLGNALSGGARAAHRWTNRPNVENAEIAINGINEPMRKAQFHRDSWALQWQSGRDDKISAGLQAVNDLRTRALQHESHGALEERFTAKAIRAAAKAFSRHTGVGADCRSFIEIAEASKDSLSELADIMRATVRHLALPTQTLCVLCALIGKKLGGTRCIAVCSTFWRILAAIAKLDVRSWDEKIGLAGDSALPGRSPHEETAWRHLQMEQATLRGKLVIHILWDVAKFFDSIDIPRLIRRCEELGFPIDQLTLAMQMHRAPRIIQAAGCCASPITSTGVSILAGCTFSTSLSTATQRMEAHTRTRWPQLLRTST